MAPHHLQLATCWSNPSTCQYVGPPIHWDSVGTRFRVWYVTDSSTSIQKFSSLHAMLSTVKIGLAYAISGFGGSLMSALFLTSNDISVGASGALFGLLGSMLSELVTNWSIYLNKVMPDEFGWVYLVRIFTPSYCQFAALLALVFIILINLAVGLFFPHVDNFAHIGGFISGFLLGFILLVRPQFRWIRQSSPIVQKHTAYQYVYWVTAAILLIAWLVGVSAALILTILILQVHHPYF